MRRSNASSKTRRSRSERRQCRRSRKHSRADRAFNVSCFTLGPAARAYGGKVTERSVMMVAVLPPPFGRFLPRLGLAGRRRRGLFIKCIVSRAQRSTKWCAADPGPLRTELWAVPDQRCTAPLCYALHRIRDTGVKLARSGAPQTRSRVYPTSALKVRKSGKPDLRGPLRTEFLAVPDQRCTVEFILGPREARTRGRCAASGRRRLN